MNDGRARSLDRVAVAGWAAVVLMSAAILLLAGPVVWGVFMLIWFGCGVLGRMS